MIESDAALVQRFTGGEENAFEQLLRRYQGPILGFIVGRVGDRVVAEDLAQETFLRCVSSIGHLRQPGAFGGWLFRIAGNVCQDHHRGKIHATEALHEDTQPADGRHRTTSGEFAATQVSQLMAERIAKLPEKQRLVILLRHQSGLRCREIAQVLGTSVGSVTKWLSRAYEALKVMIGAEA